MADRVKLCEPLSCANRGCYIAQLTTVMISGVLLVLLNRFCLTTIIDREELTLDDGGRLALDWAANLPAQCDKDDAPVLLFLSGITGSSSENYVKYCMLDGMRHGYRPVVMNYRGCGGLKLTVSSLTTLQI